MSFLEVENISKQFGTAEVLSNVSFTLNEGESLAIIGASGSGKTTLLRCLNFLEQPDSGRIILRGNVLYDAQEHEKYDDRSIREKRLHFGFVFQAFNLFPQYTAFQNIVLARELAAKKLPGYRQDKKAIIEKIHSEGMDILEQIGLASKRDLYPYQLSGGQQQRVAIARALVSKPRIVIADEPTANLDSDNGEKVLGLMKNINKEEKTTFIFSTHDPEIWQMANHIVFLHDGSVRSEQRH